MATGERRGTDGLAPVIPLFGAGHAHGGAEGDDADSTRGSGDRGSGAAPAASGASGVRAARAPVSRRAAPPAHVWHTTWDDLDPDDEIAAPVPDDAEARDAARQRVLRRLRTRALSAAEVSGMLREPGRDGQRLDGDAVDGLLRELQRNGYVDDVALAEALVRAGVERKGQGRRVVARTLAGRGIPHDVAADALRRIPDDDADRALAYAQTKVRGMRTLERDTAIRRLVGQLSRRGYPGPVALTAAQQAWDGEPD